jgi:integrase
VDRFARKHVVAEHLEDVTTGLIEGFLSRRCREDGIGPKTMNRTREVLHRLFEYAIKSWNFVSRDRRSQNPAAQVQRRREPAPTIRFLTTEQIAEQLKAIDAKVALYAPVVLMIYAGLRRDETL